MSRLEKLQKAEELLDSFDLLLLCMEKDCGRKTYLQPLKRKIKECRKQLRNIPIPIHLQL